jgi:hypothetical protein
MIKMVGDEHVEHDDMSGEEEEEDVAEPEDHIASVPLIYFALVGRVQIQPSFI